MQKEEVKKMIYQMKKKTRKVCTMKEKKSWHKENIWQHEKITPWAP